MIDSWTCHICGKDRPDALISVFKHDRSEKHGLPPGTMQENVRYCNDDLDCMKKAESHSHIKKKDDQESVASFDDDTLSKKKSRPTKNDYVLTFLGLFIIMNFLNSWLLSLVLDTTFADEFIDPVGITIRLIISVVLTKLLAPSIFKSILKK